MNKKSPLLSPRDAKTFEQISRLRRDGFSDGRYWVQLDTDVLTFSKQRRGESPEYMFDVPRGFMDRFLKWYLTPTKVARLK